MKDLKNKLNDIEEARDKALNILEEKEAQSFAFISISALAVLTNIAFELKMIGATLYSRERKDK